MNLIREDQRLMWITGNQIKIPLYIISNYTLLFEYSLKENLIKLIGNSIQFTFSSEREIKEFNKLLSINGVKHKPSKWGKSNININKTGYDIEKEPFEINVFPYYKWIRLSIENYGGILKTLTNLKEMGYKTLWESRTKEPLKYILK